MNIFKTKDKDSIYWLKVAMRQAQSDIKSLKGEVKTLKEANKTTPGKSAEDIEASNQEISRQITRRLV